MSFVLATGVSQSSNRVLDARGFLVAVNANAQLILKINFKHPFTATERAANAPATRTVVKVASVCGVEGLGTEHAFFHVSNSVHSPP
jgi:hypothetical protein